MSKFWNKKINDAEPYVAGEQPKAGVKIIKLNTNENPYAPSPKVSEALAQFDISELRLYPNTDGGELVSMTIEPETDVVGLLEEVGLTDHDEIAFPRLAEILKLESEPWKE